MLKAGELAAIAYQETIMASILGFVMFGEVLTTFQLIGGALIIIGGVAQVLVSTKSVEEKVEAKEEQQRFEDNLSAKLDKAEEEEFGTR